MITRVLTTLAVGLGLAAAPALAASDDNVVSVYVDRAKVAQLPPGTSTLVIGNPAIADVTMLKANSVMVITGKGYGETNLIALDAKGDILDEKDVRVLSAKTALIVQRGDSKLSYNCDPLCERTPAAQRRSRSPSRPLGTRSKTATIWPPAVRLPRRSKRSGVAPPCAA